MEPTLPIYHQIRRAIKNDILEKAYKPGDRIPPEQELSTLFNVNRITIRQALSSLVDEGLLIRKRGEGTFVTDREDLINQMTFKHIGMTNELLLPLKNSKTFSVTIEEVEPMPIIREKLELNQDVNLVTRLKRDRLTPEGFRIYTINHLPVEIGRQLTEEALLNKPLLNVLEEDLGIDFIEVYQTIEASFADEETAESLGIKPGNPTLVSERIMYGEHGKPVEVVNSIYQANLYKCSLRLKKVKSESSYDWICQIVT